MENHLSLIKNEVGTQEKRTLPRFPFCYLTFKCTTGSTRVFEVVDISYTGMQLSLKSGEFSFKKGELLDGVVHWIGDNLAIKAKIIWQSESRLGVEFANSVKYRALIDEFLTVERFAKHLKPIHDITVGVELPSNLSYWLRSDGPAEVFIWNHPNRSFQCFQILVMDQFVEWEDGAGLKTGRVLSKRGFDTPLLSEDEFVFLFDSNIDPEKTQKALDFILASDPALYSTQARDFLSMKLGH